MGKRRVPPRDVAALNQARLDDLLEGDALSEGDMGDLFALLRGRGTSAEREGDQCSECSGTVYLDVEQAHHFCSGCALVQAPRLYDHERITCAPREGYKPVHHLHERLSQYALLESAICPSDWLLIVERLLLEKPAILDKECVRMIVRRCKLQRYNESWLQVINRVTKYRPPPISQSETLLLARIFEGVQEPFRLFKHSSRKNLLNYNFLLFRLLQLIGREDTLRHFPQLKTQAKLQELDRVWGSVCEFNGWDHPPLEISNFKWLSVELGPETWPRLEAELLRAAWAAIESEDAASELQRRTRGARQPGYSDRRLLREMGRVKDDQARLRSIQLDNARRHPKGQQRPRSTLAVSRAVRARSRAS